MSLPAPAPTPASAREPDAALEGQFGTIRRLMYDIAGVHLGEAKVDLVRSRLSKRIRALGRRGFRDYVEHVLSPEGREELATMVDVLTTNKTSFFRESGHFELLARQVVPERLRAPGELRIWSAGCSSGEEPYTLAMVLLETVPEARRRDVRILATDISARMVARAREAVYDEDRLDDVPEALRRRYFERAPSPAGGPARYAVGAAARSLVQVARLNLMEPWPMKGPFHVIFCRNVMIYFDRRTRERLVRRFADLLAPGGYLFVGHSESLHALNHGLRYVQPAVYRR